MTDFTENTDNILSYKGQGRGCYVAYTLNNEQPVSCTIIGDTPLFYMDTEEEACIDDEFLNEEEIEILEQEIEALKKEIALSEKNSNLWAEDEEEKRISFHENALDLFMAEEKIPECTEEELRQALRKSRLATAYLESFDTYHGQIHFTGEVDNAFYDRQTSKILINDNLDKETAILLCARELRRHWQHRAGALVHPLTLTPDHAVLINRVQTCDLVTSMIRIAWEMQLSGEKTVWEKIEDTSLADLGRAFAREAFLDFRTINNGVASACVFEAWFLSERCMKEDKVLIQQMLADYQGFVFDTDATHDYLTAELIAALGEMPYGKNYLAQHVGTIMSDPIFTDVRDRSNANFLWFVKFERSFRETEQKLQTPSDLHGHDTGQGRISDTKGLDDDTAQNGQSAEIIQLFKEDADAARANDGCKKLEAKKQARHRKVSGKENGQGSGAEIVVLKRIPSES